MPLPHASEARLFYQAAWQRYEDAHYLLDAARTTGAVYLAGYSVECILKALTLNLLTARKIVKMMESFRGWKAHDFDWLRKQYFRNGGPPFPAGIARRFALVASWKTDLRYQAVTIRVEDAKKFLQATHEILTWADGRF